MKALSQRSMDRLRSLQAAMRQVAHDRSAALRNFTASRYTTTPDAQREFWLEFSWFDQEYRVAVRRLAQFCAAHCEQDMSGLRSLT
jgi:hypothetical protein